MLHRQAGARQPADGPAGGRPTGRSQIFAEEISTRIKVLPELETALALALARGIRQAAPTQPVILTVHEMKRLARNAAELMTPSATLQAAGIPLELLTGPLTGVYDPNGMGRCCSPRWRSPPSWTANTSARRLSRASRPPPPRAITAAGPA